MSQYGLYCYHSCQVWYWSIVRLSMDSIVIIAVRSGTGVLYVSVWILVQYSSTRHDIYDNNRIHTETYNTPVPDLTAMITIESILRRLCMDFIVIIAVRSGTGLLYVSVRIILLS
jgi:hypothetical protein